MVIYTTTINIIVKAKMTTTELKTDVRVNIKPDNKHTTSPDGKYLYHTYYRPHTKKNGEIMWHPQRITVRVKCHNTPAKNKIMTSIKKKITHNPDISVEDIQIFLNLLTTEPQRFKRFITTPYIVKRYTSCKCVKV